MAIINYTGLDQVKDYIISTTAPKYFDMEDVNDLNVGLLGYTTEVQANTTEDTFNALSMYVKEAFPNLAQLPETLYNYAAILDIKELFANPSQLQILLFVKESDIIEKGTKGASMIDFVIDRQIVIDIDGITFSPDYNIVIAAKPHRGDYIFSAQYDMTYKNTISDETIPYLKTIRVPINNEKYLGVIIPKAHQVTMTVQDDIILDNDVINNTTITVEYEDQLAGFDILYKPAGSSKYIELTKIISGSTPLKTPFCFYKLKDDNTYQISFTMMDGYFQPEFNADLRIMTYTTKGEQGNFSEYKGSNIQAAPSSTEFDYNNNTIILALPQGSSVNGQSAIGLEFLRSMIVEKWASSGAYNAENDLQLYLENYARRNNTKVLFVKKRDDLMERLFSSFSLFKDYMGDYYPTNTLSLKLFEEDFDTTFVQDGRSTINAGSVFGYDGMSNSTAVRLRGKTNKDTFPSNEFVYTTPFVISVQKSPNIVGYYLNSVNKKVKLDYADVNINSYYQFISNTLSIKRDALKGEKDYKISATFVPATTLPDELTKVPEGSPEGTLPEIYSRMKIILTMTDSSADICYKEMTITQMDPETGIITAECALETNDTITRDEKLLFTNINDIETGEEASKVVPMIDCVLNVYTMFKYDEPQEATAFSINEFDAYTVTNRYSTQSDPISFMVPMNIIKSRCKFVPYKKENELGEMEDSYYYLVELVPLLKYDAISDEAKFDEYITLLHDIYAYLHAILDDVTNNYSVDMKFYNTYGRSNNFVAGNDERQLDRVNISIEFKVAPKLGAKVDDLIPRLKIFIKEYIESANIADSKSNVKGYNAVYVSNLMRMIETTFVNEIDHHQFVRINDYDSSVQVIENKTVDMSTLSQEERRSYVPEYLTINLDDIKLELLYK